MDKDVKFSDWLNAVVAIEAGAGGEEVQGGAQDEARTPQKQDRYSPVRAYLQFSDAMREIAREAGAAAPQSPEQALLELITSQALARQALTVSDVIVRRDIASPSTVHAKLMLLRRTGWVSWQLGPDGRTKYLQPTERALEYFLHAGCNLQTHRGQ